MGRGRKRYRTPRKSTGENDHSQSGQGQEIATPPAQHTSPRRGIEMNSSDPHQTEESGIGNDIYYAASAVSPNANNQVPRVPLFIVDCTAKPVPNAEQTLEDQQFKDRESKQLFLQCLQPSWHRDLRVFAQRFEKYSNKAHLSTVKAAIQYSETLLQNQDNFSLTLNPQMRKMNIHAFRTLQRPPLSQKIFLERFLTVQLSTGRLKCAMILSLFLSMFKAFQSMEG
jgi:hypothetical protein